jgi:hypothetical protein
VFDASAGNGGRHSKNRLDSGAPGLGGLASGDVDI